MAAASRVDDRDAPRRPPDRARGRRGRLASSLRPRSDPVDEDDLTHRTPVADTGSDGDPAAGRRRAQVAAGAVAAPPRLPAQREPAVSTVIDVVAEHRDGRRGIRGHRRLGGVRTRRHQLAVRFATADAAAATSSCSPLGGADRWHRSSVAAVGSRFAAERPRARAVAARRGAGHSTRRRAIPVCRGADARGEAAGEPAGNGNSGTGNGNGNDKNRTARTTTAKGNGKGTGLSRLAVTGVSGREVGLLPRASSSVGRASDF